MEIERECFSDKLYMFYISIGVEPPSPNPIIILDGEGDKKISLPSLIFEVDMADIDGMEISDFNINLAFFYFKSFRICNFIELIVFEVLILFKSFILSLFKNFLLLMDESVLQHLPSIIN